MSENILVGIKKAIEEVKTLKRKEAYKILDKKTNYMIGIGAKNITSKKSYFFIEVIVSLCSKSGKLDLEIIKTYLNCLEELFTRNYTLACQDDNTILCDKTVDEEVVRLILKKTFEY
ncbi:MAG: hypothetical protein H5T50_06575 [Nitrososphaeria archaeon]|nr:hypothetical protein [Nitrososphaeria archaeon]